MMFGDLLEGFNEDLEALRSFRGSVGYILEILRVLRAYCFFYSIL